MLLPISTWINCMLQSGNIDNRIFIVYDLREELGMFACFICKWGLRFTLFHKPCVFVHLDRCSSLNKLFGICIFFTLNLYPVTLSFSKFSNCVLLNNPLCKWLISPRICCLNFLDVGRVPDLTFGGPYSMIIKIQ